MAVIPVAKTLFLCEEIDAEGGLLNLYGLFRTFRAASFPYTRESFCVFVQLSGGLGVMPSHYDIRRASDGALVRASTVRPLHFERRTQVLQLVTTFEGITFDVPGAYLVELFCDNMWVADVVFDVAEEEL